MTPQKIIKTLRDHIKEMDSTITMRRVEIQKREAEVQAIEAQKQQLNLIVGRIERQLNEAEKKPETKTTSTEASASRAEALEKAKQMTEEINRKSDWMRAYLDSRDMPHSPNNIAEAELAYNEAFNQPNRPKR